MAVMESAAGRLPREVLEPFFMGHMHLISELYKSGAVAEARTCLTCKYVATLEGKYYCSLLKSFLTAEEMRVNCADHKLAARPVQWKAN